MVAKDFFLQLHEFQFIFLEVQGRIYFQKLLHLANYIYLEVVLFSLILSNYNKNHTL